MEKKPLVIVTGSCGRIGTEIVKRLGGSYSVVGFGLLKAIYASKFEELVPVDLSSDESVAQAFLHIKHFYGTKIASVIHLAAYYSFQDKFSPLYDKVTVKGTERLINALKDFEVEQFIFSSTLLLHKPTAVGKPIDESGELQGDWGYPRSKIETEKLLHERHGKMPVLNLRIAGVYDDLCHSIPISNQIQRIYEKDIQARFFPGNPKHGASFIHMDDLIEAMALSVDKRKELPQEETLLIGEPTTLSYQEIQNLVSSLLHQKPQKLIRIPKLIAKLGAWVQCHLPLDRKPFVRPSMIDFADDHYEVNITKAKQVLGWSPKKDLKSTLPKMVEALLDDPIRWYKINGLFIPYWLHKKHPS